MGGHRIDDDEPDELSPESAGAGLPRPTWAGTYRIPIDGGPQALSWADEPTDDRTPIPGSAGGGPPGDRSDAARADRFQSRLMIAGVITLILAILTVLLAALPGPGTSPTGTGAQSDVDDGPGALPSAAPYPVLSATSPAGSPSATPAPSAAPSDATVPAAPPTPAPTDGASSTPLPAAGLSAVYSVQDSWPGGFIAQVMVNNDSAGAEAWQVVIQYPGSVTGYVAGWSNAPAQPSTVATSDSATITGAAPLPAGQSVSVFVQFDMQGSSGPAPTVCAVNSDTCTVT